MLYSWQNSDSVIRNIDFIRPNKVQDALIYAPEGVSASDLQRVPRILREKGYAVEADTVDGKHVLRVHNVDSRQEFLKLLSDTGLVSGQPFTRKTQYDIKPKKSFVEKIKDHTVEAAGVVYLLADACFALSGLVRGSPAEAAQGLLWASSGVALAGWGKKDADIQTARLYKAMNEYLEAEGIDITKDDAEVIEKLSAKNGVINKLQNFLYDNPVEVNNTIQSIGGALMVKAGMEQRNPITKQRNYFKVFAGSAVAASQAAGMLVEPRPNPYYPSKGVDVHRGSKGDMLLQQGKALTSDMHAGGGVMGAGDCQQQHRRGEEEEGAAEELSGTFTDRAKAWFLEKPLRITGVGTISNNIANLYAAYVWERPKINEYLHGKAGKVAESALELKEAKSALGRFIDRGSGEVSSRAPVGAVERLRNVEHKIELAQKYKKGLHLNGVGSVLYMVANVLYGSSDTDTSVDIKAAGGLDKVYNSVAHIVAGQPRECRAEIVNRIAGFLSSQPDVNDSAVEIVNDISRRVSELEKNPWMEKVSEPHPLQHIVDAEKSNYQARKLMI